MVERTRGLVARMRFHRRSGGTRRRGGKEVGNRQCKHSQHATFFFDIDEHQGEDAHGFIQEAPEEVDAGARATEDRSATGPGNSGSSDSRALFERPGDGYLERSQRRSHATVPGRQRVAEQDRPRLPSADQVRFGAEQGPSSESGERDDDGAGSTEVRISGSNHTFRAGRCGTGDSICTAQFECCVEQSFQPTVRQLLSHERCASAVRVWCATASAHGAFESGCNRPDGVETRWPANSSTPVSRLLPTH